MIYIVELTIAEPNSVRRMNEMRTWLDHRHVEPTRFRFVVGDASAECRAHFTSEAEAAAFAREFGGEVSAIEGVAAGGGAVSSGSASSFEPGRVRPN